MGLDTPQVQGWVMLAFTAVIAASTTARGLILGEKSSTMP